MLQGSYLCFLMRNTFNYTKLLFSIIRGIEKQKNTIKIVLFILKYHLISFSLHNAP